jgi:phosphoribosyl 1,2-cyclic phosphate phosphodiesterase
MKVTLLGTGTSQGIPVIGCKCETCTSTNPKDKRLRVSAYLEIPGYGINGSDTLKILIDTSSDFRQQMLANKFDDIDCVLFTHHHIDHIGGMDDLRQINQQKKKKIDIYGNKLTLDEIKVTFRYVLDERLQQHNAVPLINFNYITLEPFQINGLEIIPIEIYHGYLPIYGYRIQNFAYITDASLIPEPEFEKLKNLDVLVLNALRRKPHPTHFSLEQAVEAGKRINAKQTYFTHITHDMKHEDVNKTLPENIQLGYDGLSFEI